MQADSWDERGARGIVGGAPLVAIAHALICGYLHLHAVIRTCTRLFAFAHLHSGDDGHGHAKQGEECEVAMGFHGISGLERFLRWLAVGSQLACG